MKHGWDVSEVRRLDVSLEIADREAAGRKLLDVGDRRPAPALGWG